MLSKISFVLFFVVFSGSLSNELTPRPMRIRLVNYERRFVPKHVPTPPDVGQQSSSAPAIAMLMSDEPVTAITRTERIGGYAGSYLQEVRRRMRAGGKIHTASTALTIPHLSSKEESAEILDRRIPQPDARKVFDDETSAQKSTTQTPVSTASVPITPKVVSPSSTLSTVTTSETTTTSPPPQNITTSGTTVTTANVTYSPEKVKPQLPREEVVFPLDDETEKPKNDSLQPLEEFEIKSDQQLQKTLQRTTMTIQSYKDGKTIIPLSLLTTTTPPTSTTSLTNPLVFTIPPLFPPLADAPIQTAQSPQLLNPQFPQQQTGVTPSAGSLLASVKPSDALEQLGCGFDLLTQSCKDVFGLGWCAQCTDLGNVFLHDCKCAARTPLGRTANALFAQPPTSTPLVPTANPSLGIPTVGALPGAPLPWSGPARS